MLEMVAENWDKSARCFESALKLKPAEPYKSQAQDYLASLKGLKQQDSTPEGKTLRRYVEALMRGYQALSQGNLDFARKCAAFAMKTDKEQWEGYYLAAQVYTADSNFDTASEVLKAAIQKAPDDRKAKLQALLDSLPREKEYAELVASGRQAATECTALVAAGNRAGADKRGALARQKLGQAYKLFPDRPSSSLPLAAVLLTQGRTTEAAVVFARLLQARTR